MQGVHTIGRRGSCRHIRGSKAAHVGVHPIGRRSTRCTPGATRSRSIIDHSTGPVCIGAVGIGAVCILICTAGIIAGVRIGTRIRVGVGIGTRIGIRIRIRIRVGIAVSIIIRPDICIGRHIRIGTLIYRC
jgi:hypothetical protein